MGRQYEDHDNKRSKTKTSNDVDVWYLRVLWVYLGTRGLILQAWRAPTPSATPCVECAPHAKGSRQGGRGGHTACSNLL